MGGHTSLLTQLIEYPAQVTAPLKALDAKENFTAWTRARITMRAQPVSSTSDPHTSMD